MKLGLRRKNEGWLSRAKFYSCDHFDELNHYCLYSAGRSWDGGQNADSILGQQHWGICSIVEKLGNPPYNFYLMILLCTRRRKAVSQKFFVRRGGGCGTVKKKERKKKRKKKERMNRGNAYCYGGLLFHRFLYTLACTHSCVWKMAKEREEQAIISGLSYKTEMGEKKKMTGNQTPEWLYIAFNSPLIKGQHAVVGDGWSRGRLCREWLHSEKSWHDS